MQRSAKTMSTFAHPDNAIGMVLAFMGYGHPLAIIGQQQHEFVIVAIQ